jgi:hypothetical protein
MHVYMYSIIILYQHAITHGCRHVQHHTVQPVPIEDQVISGYPYMHICRDISARIPKYTLLYHTIMTEGINMVPH